MIIRQACANDATSIARVHLASREAIYSALRSDGAWWEESLSSRTRKWKTILASPRTRTLVAEKNEQVVGFANFSSSRTDGIDPGLSAEINTTYVIPQGWRSGIGRALVTQAIMELRSERFEEIILWCLDSNLQAREFYESLGFVACGRCREQQMGGSVVRDLLYRVSLRCAGKEPLLKSRAHRILPDNKG